MKTKSLIGWILCLAMLLTSCSDLDPADLSSASSNDIPDPMKEVIVQRCEEITTLYRHLYRDSDRTEAQTQWDDPVLSQSGIDAIECLLTDAGLDVIDTNGPYPGYLVTGERFYSFWDDANRNKNTEQEIISIRENGDLSYRLFTSREGKTYVHSMSYPMDEAFELYYEKHEILEWTLTDRGNFYYRVYPAGNKIYSDFSLIRMAKPDTELYDLTIKYIHPGDYLAANIFLTDWTEADFGRLSFNDLWEYLFFDYHGKQFWPEEYGYITEKGLLQIPAAEFERVVLPYFDIDLETFRDMAHYDAEGECYPWRDIQTNDFVFLYYYAIEPEVTGYRVNPDGTVTLTVDVLSTDLKTDRLFAHEVTVRPLDDGSFQYVGNQVTYQTENGLPYCEPRLTWDVTRPE